MVYNVNVLMLLIGILLIAKGEKVIGILLIYNSLVSPFWIKKQVKDEFEKWFRLICSETNKLK